MANPQVEDGYTKIANELLEAVSRVNLSSYELRVLMAIIRKTYGFNKKEDYISLSQLEKITGIKACHICRTLKKLKEKNMLLSNGHCQGIQKDYELWTTTQTGNTHSGNTQTGKKVTHIGNEVTQTGNKKLPIQVDTKEKKETIQKKDTYCSDLKNKSEPKVKINFNHATEKWENIEKKHTDNWEMAYPACDIFVELAKMKQWVLANGAKGHKSNWLKFITNWLSRSQDRGGTKNV